MRYQVRTLRRQARLLSLCAALALLLVSALPAFAETGPDYAIAGGWFFTQTGGGSGNGFAVRDAGADANGKVIKFWTEFQRLGGINTLGYPVGQPYVGGDGFTYQPFQRGVLQWRPELGLAFLSNTFEALQSAGKDDWLLSVKGVPKPIVDDGSAGDYSKALATRLGWLTDDSIKAKFLANPNPQAIASWSRDIAIQLYGLPMSQPEKHGPFVAQRFQRITFQLWVEDVAGMPAKGTVVGVLGGDLLKEASLLPAAAIQALGPGGVQLAQAPLPAPAPAPSSYAWHPAIVEQAPNCGTTYMYAHVLDANGNGVNGIAIKSWNDWGNEYVASTRNYNGKDGYWDRVVSSGVKAGKWYAAVLDGSGKQASDTATINFTASCDPGQGAVQQVGIEFRSGSVGTP